MAIPGAYRRWPYPSFSTPVAAAATAPEVPPPLDVPPPRRRHVVLTQFERWRDDVAEVPWVDHEWQIPRGKPWSYSEFEHWDDEPITKVEVPFTPVPWQMPRTKPWLPEWPGKLVDVPREAHVDIQWHLPFSRPWPTVPWQHLVPFVTEPPPPRTDPLPPFTQWHLVRRRARPVPDPWQPWVPTGGGFPYFVDIEWQIPRRHPPIIEPFGLLDFTSRDEEPGVTGQPPPGFPPLPPPRAPSPVPYIPIVVPGELFVEFVPNCPRPLRRPDTKC